MEPSAGAVTLPVVKHARVTPTLKEEISIHTFMSDFMLRIWADVGILFKRSVLHIQRSIVTFGVVPDVYMYLFVKGMARCCVGYQE